MLVLTHADNASVASVECKIIAW